MFVNFKTVYGFEKMFMKLKMFVNLKHIAEFRIFL